MAAGTPLKEWDVHINYGIKTGLNDAFIIDSATRDALIAADPKSAEIIRPILRGRDIKRYEYSSPELWLLYVPWHFPIEDDNSIVGASERAEQLFQDQYPAVYAHLVSYKEKLFERNKAETGIRYEWYALQRWGANYRDDFSKQKIVWGNLSLSAQYAWVSTDYIINNPANFIVNGDLYLLGVLNSKVADFYIRSLGVTRNGGYFEYKPMFVEKLPVPQLQENEKKVFSELVSEILKLKGSGIDSSKLESQLDELVFDLYRLSESERFFLRDRSNL